MQTDEEIGKVAAAVPVIICILLGAGWAEGRGAGLRHSPFWILLDVFSPGP